MGRAATRPLTEVASDARTLYSGNERPITPPRATGLRPDTVTTGAASVSPDIGRNARPANTVKRLAFSPMATPSTTTEIATKPGCRFWLRIA
jgi:hypothetical protein